MKSKVIIFIIILAFVSQGTGSGFGTYDSAYKDWTNVKIRRGSISRIVQITRWSDTLINVYSPSASSGDMATVNGIYGTISAKVTK